MTHVNLEGEEHVGILVIDEKEVPLLSAKEREQTRDT